jgi:DNA repair protein RadA/Sms
MGKAATRIALSCSACGQPASQWAGRCGACGAWGSIVERPAVATGSGLGKRGPAVSTLGFDEASAPRVSTGFPGVDRVLGGGLVPASVVLLAGEPGIGKSTLLLQLAARLSGSGLGCLIASGEESRAQVAARARRLGLDGERLSFVPGRDLEDVLRAAREQAPFLLAVDSIQTLRDVTAQTVPGGPAQVRACADALVGLAKSEGVTVVMTGHVTKEGDLAGPRTLEHAVDVVCSFEGDARSGLRVLGGGKNRFGPEGEVAWFEMGNRGLDETDPSGYLSQGDGEPGSATALLLTGRRAVALEVQALAVDTDGPARRQATGLDPRRFPLLAAVVGRAGSIPLARKEVYGATAHGLRVDDPGCDLAVAAALASAATGRAVPERSAFVGELALTGQVRPAAGLVQRLAAARLAGVATVFAAGHAEAPEGVRLVPVRHVRDALRWVRGGGKGG